MPTSLFNELAVVIAIGAVVALIMRAIRQPLIIAYIITGLIVGPSVLNIVSNDQTINVFSSIGIALLLFIIGLGLNPKVIKEVGKVASIAGAAQIFLIAGTGFLVSRAFDYTKTESVLVGMGLAFSSTIIILKLLSDQKEQTRLHGKVTIGILLIQDIIAALLLILVNARSEGSFSSITLLELFAKGALILIPLFLIGNLILPRLNKLIAGSQEMLFLFAIGWGFGAAALFERYGFSIEVGALFAGVALSNLAYSQEIASRLRPLRDFFVVVFFIALGTKLNFGNLDAIWLPVLALSAIVIILKPLITMIIMGLMGYTKNTSFKTSISMAQISEFSLVLVIVANQQGLVRQDIINIITIVALISIAISAYAITYGNKLYSVFKDKLNLFERQKTKSDHKRVHHYDMVLFGYKKGGSEFMKVMEQMNKKFVIVDYDPEVLDALINQNINFVYGDATDMELLNELNAANAKMVVSTIGDHPSNIFLARWLERINPSAVFVCSADNVKQASELYDEGVAYVMMPHYIGSEKISSFIRRNGFNKTEFRKFREKHLQYLQAHSEQAL
jgi:Kef-type K+ transport system membrane component KefB